ncbi:hypothetical protein AAG570_001353 [Ranatra chinensis]|uniref:Uncharacterized protein n=1 Tax=Ranatra chinensis TaxID=642074 RepID=A0ABD0YBN2_9HEMI
MNYDPDAEDCDLPKPARINELRAGDDRERPENELLLWPCELPKPNCPVQLFAQGRRHVLPPCIVLGMPEKRLEDDVGDVEMALDLLTIPPEVEEYARTKVGETPDTKIQAIEDFKELIYLSPAWTLIGPITKTDTLAVISTSSGIPRPSTAQPHHHPNPIQWRESELSKTFRAYRNILICKKNHYGICQLCPKDGVGIDFKTSAYAEHVNAHSAQDRGGTGSDRSAHHRHPQRHNPYKFSLASGGVEVKNHVATSVDQDGGGD